MMKSRFVKFIRVYWKGLLLYAIGGGLVSFIIILYITEEQVSSAWKDISAKA